MTKVAVLYCNNFNSIIIPDYYKFYIGEYMGAFLPNYNDPIISILLLLGIIFIVSILSYGYTIWKQEQRQKELVGFLKSFDSNETPIDTKSMEFEPSMQKPLTLLAHAFAKSGEYSKAINLYLYLIKHTNDRALLEYLAESYHKAGFLQRSIDIYKEILYNTPRDRKTLYRLELTYEQLQDLNGASEVLDILQELGEDVSKLQSNLALQFIKRDNQNPKDRFEKYVKLLNSCSKKWAVLREMFMLNPLEAWEYYDDKEFKKLVDILWKLDIAHLNLDIIARHNTLKKLYYAKGLLQESSDKPTLFAIDLIASAKECGNSSGDLQFKYICSNCKTLSPLPFVRCYKCHRVYSMDIEVLIEAKREKSSYTLQ